MKQSYDYGPLPAILCCSWFPIELSANLLVTVRAAAEDLVERRFKVCIEISQLGAVTAEMSKKAGARAPGAPSAGLALVIGQFGANLCFEDLADLGSRHSAHPAQPGARRVHSLDGVIQCFECKIST
jgi:hypothetical protein